MYVQSARAREGESKKTIAAAMLSLCGCWAEERAS